MCIHLKSVDVVVTPSEGGRLIKVSIFVVKIQLLVLDQLVVAAALSRDMDGFVAYWK